MEAINRKQIFLQGWILRIKGCLEDVLSESEEKDRKSLLLKSGSNLVPLEKRYGNKSVKKRKGFSSIKKYL
jgi:hypothetical protein